MEWKILEKINEEAFSHWMWFHTSCVEVVCGKCTFNSHKLILVWVDQSLINPSPATQCDVLLVRIPYIFYTERRWLSKFPATFKPYHKRRLELTLIILLKEIAYCGQLVSLYHSAFKRPRCKSYTLGSSGYFLNEVVH